MSLQGLGLSAVHTIERATGLRVLRATVNNGGDWRWWSFTTDGHRHGAFERYTGQVEWETGPDAHTRPMCEALFGTYSLPRDETWGVFCPKGRWHVRDGAGIPWDATCRYDVTDFGGPAW